MWRSLIVCSLALCTALGSAVPAVTMTASEEVLFAAASSLEDRVAERRAARANRAEGPERQRPRIRLRTLIQNRRPTITQEKQPIRRSRRDIRRQARLRQQEEEQSRTARARQRRQERRKRLAEKRTLKEQVIFATNVERQNHNVPPLTFNGLLEKAAQKHAEDMLHRAYFDHENPDGLRSGDRIKAAGYGEFDMDPMCNCVYKLYMGENIARGQKSVEQVVREWMASPPHRKAMLSTDYNEIGIGIIDDIWVQNFGAMIVEPLE